MNTTTATTHQSSIMLNSEQQKVLAHTHGPLLIVAGAGSGKTFVVTSYIIELLTNRHVPAHAIVGLTFTNKAAGEMAERIERKVAQKQKPFIGTFHSYCLQLLKVYRAQHGQPAFSILDSDDQQTLLQNIIKRSRIEQRTNPKTIAHHISAYKNSFVTDSNESLFTDPLFREILLEYEREKRASNCLDFDDLLLEALQLFKTDTAFKERHQQTVRHILVDEYQDTNSTQHALLKAMTLQGKDFAIDSLCAVGDEDQSIYSWRGAQIKNMLQFSSDFPNTTIIKIEQNYRCAQSILDVANHIIANNRYRNPKNLWSTKSGTDRTRLIHCFSGYQEGIVISQLITQARKAPKTTGHSIAILYRAHYQSRTIEEALIRNSIAYTIVGGIEFYERKEIKDMLAYLKLIANPFDRIAFFRIINCPLRGLGEKFQEQVYAIWQEQPFYSFEQCLQHMLTHDMVQGVKKEQLEQFITLINEGRLYAHSVHQALNHFVQHTNYIGYLQTTFDKDEAETKRDNIRELLRAAEHLEKTGTATIEDFLAHVALMQQHVPEEETQTPITLMTIHAAKGLEFDIVIISGLEEGIFPNTRSLVDPEMIEEERRLLYVAITRAKEYLLLTHAKSRQTFGSLSDQTPSRFLSEIPAGFVKSITAVQFNDIQIRDLFKEWFGNSSPSSVFTAQSFRQSQPSTTRTATQVIPKAPIAPIANSWHVNQNVKHPQFGIGTIHEIDVKDSVTTILTIQFSSGIKKIKSSFVQAI